VQQAGGQPTPRGEGLLGGEGDASLKAENAVLKEQVKQLESQVKTAGSAAAGGGGTQATKLSLH